MKCTRANLKKLEELCQNLGYKVRYEQGHFQSGYCRVESKKILVVNKFFDVEARVNCLLELIPDLPLEEQDEIKEFLQKENAPILIQLVSPVSKDRIPEILKDARGFVYCVSSMGVTGQEATFHKSVIDYLGSVKEVSKIPVMMGFGIRTAEDVAPMKNIIDGAIVGSHFIRLMEENDYDLQAIGTYCGTFKKELNQ